MDAAWARRDGPEEARALDEAVRAAQAGDPRAFERIVARFREPLTAYATALLRDRGYAEDATQEAFVHAFRNLRRLRSPALLRPWLYAILENCALSAWRSRKRRRTFALGDGHAVAEGDEAGARLSAGLTIAWPGGPDAVVARAVRIRDALRA